MNLTVRFHHNYDTRISTTIIDTTTITKEKKLPSFSFERSSGKRDNKNANF